MQPRVWVEDATYPGLFNTVPIANGEDLVALEAALDIRWADNGSSENQGMGYLLTSQTQASLQSGTLGYFVHASIVQIRLPNNANPNLDLNIVYAKENVVNKCNDLADHTIYLEGITAQFSGSLDVFHLKTSSDASVIALNRCEALNSRVASGIQIEGNGLAVTYRCYVKGSYKDGFNYHSNFLVSGSTFMNVLEIECKSRFNGFEPGALTHNGSTIHSTLQGIRLNCDHSHNRNRNVHDVGGGAQSFNVGVEARGSWTDMAGIQCGFDVSADIINMWLVGCNTDNLVIGDGGTNNNCYITDDTVYASLR